MEEGEQTVKTSKYNSGIAQIYRLDSLWRSTHLHSRSGKFNLWNLDLDRLWCELAKDLSDEEYGNYKKKFDYFDSELLKTGAFIDTPPSGWADFTPEQVEKRNKQYKVLTDKDLFLRRLENHLGKGTAWDDGDEDDFE